METLPKKRGRRAIDPATKKKAFSLSLSPPQIEAIEAKSAGVGLSPSAYVVKKLKLDAGKPVSQS